MQIAGDVLCDHRDRIGLGVYGREKLFVGNLLGGTLGKPFVIAECVNGVRVVICL